MRLLSMQGRKTAANDPSLRMSPSLVRATHKMPTKKRPYGRFVAVARPALSITGPLIITVGIVIGCPCDGSRFSSGYASRNPNGPGAVIRARPIAAIVVAMVIATRGTHAISAAQIVRVRVAEPDHAGLLGGFLRHRRRCQRRANNRGRAKQCQLHHRSLLHLHMKNERARRDAGSRDRFHGAVSFRGDRLHVASKRKGRRALRHRPSLATAGSEGPVPLR